MFEQDYIMRIVKEIARVLAKVLFNKEVSTLIEEKKSVVRDGCGDDDIFSMADKGEINKAENILDDIIENNPREGTEMGIAFYAYINEFDNEFLEKSNFSRDEIKLGLERIVKRTGLKGLTSVIL